MEGVPAFVEVVPGLDISLARLLAILPRVMIARLLRTQMSVHIGVILRRVPYAPRAIYVTTSLKLPGVRLTGTCIAGLYTPPSLAST
jgi:hypothetical protein